MDLVFHCYLLRDYTLRFAAYDTRLPKAPSARRLHYGHRDSKIERSRGRSYGILLTVCV